MDIDCQFGFNQYEMYSCFVTSAVITNPFHVIKLFKGVHLDGKSNEDIILISFDKTNVEYFPRDLHKHFPNLKRVYISECGLKEILRWDLKGLCGLQHSLC